LRATNVVQHRVNRPIDSRQPDDYLLRTGLVQALGASERAHRRDHMRAGAGRKLDSEPAHSAGRARDEHPPAEHRAGSTQRPQRGEAGDGQRRHLGQINRRWDLGQRADVDRGSLREGTRRQGHHPRAYAGTAVRGRLGDDTGGIRAEHSARWHAAGSGVVEITVVQ
jgi:hypothetical protein